MSEKILRKSHMYRLFTEGAFGNRPRTWPCLDDLLSSDFRGQIGMFERSERHGGGLVEYYVPVSEVEARVRAWRSHNVQADRIQFTEMAPHEHNLIQGEVTGPMNCPTPEWGWDWSLSYSVAPDLTMRAARALPWQTMTGCVRPFLRQLLDEPSWDNLERLVETYPEHVIEISTFRRRVGELGWNTIFWEVRLY